MSDEPNEDIAEPTDNEWDPLAADWDGDEAVVAYAAAVFGSLGDVLRRRGVALAGAKAIDFGCGTGLLTEQLLGAGVAEVLAIDTSPAMRAVLDRKILEQSWRGVTTSGKMAVGPASATVVACSSVCGFVADYPGTVVELTQSLKPGGLFIQWDWERTDEDTHGLSRVEIEAALGKAGLEDVEVKTAFEVEVWGETMAPLVGFGWRPHQ